MDLELPLTRHPSRLPPRKQGQVRSTRGDRLLVVGGGPAGVAAATSAAQSGARVILAERCAQLGGQLAIAGRTIRHRELWQQWLRWAHRELSAGSVDVRLNHPVNESACANFDQVIIATGAIPARPCLNWEGSQAVLSSWSAIMRPAPLTGSVLIADQEHEWSAVDAAEILATHGYAVTLMTDRGTPASLLRSMEREAYLDRLTTLGVRILRHHRLLTTVRDGTIIQDIDRGRRFPVPQNMGAIVIASHRSPNITLWEKVKHMPNAKLVGDAVAPGSLEGSITHGSRVGDCYF
ncbi:FAD-dependent oxidoreductase [Streptomyces sp. NPDC051133]|uniref:FAD-dependent oxidoreductase n=1 Tax=Streptomyces sp. NPDC051133 TaxID=3155521 RepID=UPI003436FD11